ncbi:hypothetical protein SKAU_G00306080 [Synaphobranchus kaupii]|uniref:Uncharacterized protein n=1 Tax=Synaphobranchus kaupii TaxID=118154 RepID=A0A9Q1EQM7_SYNKA|nr:hypothetical protein SKAU_G00306080 [Synaphobranchus kaupii]
MLIHVCVAYFVDAGTAKRFICHLFLSDSAVATLVQRQKELSKALETQKYLNKSLKPLYTALLPQEDHMLRPSPQSGEHP